MIANLDSLRASLGSVSNQANPLLERALEAATSWVAERVYPESLDSSEVQEAIVLLAARLYKRRQSPEGVAGWADLGVVRIVARDPDVAMLLEHHLDMRVAGLA